jgi:hypothetical protein
MDSLLENHGRRCELRRIESRLINLINMTEWIEAREALARLRVRPQTLYAYVSRGRVHAEPDPRDPRRSRYRASDIAALQVRKARGRKAADVAADAIAWGEPVLASAVTTVADGRLYYRGRDAARLAETETLESVARLLRGGQGIAVRRTLRARLRRPGCPRRLGRAGAGDFDCKPGERSCNLARHPGRRLHGRDRRRRHP